MKKSRQTDIKVSLTAEQAAFLTDLCQAHYRGLYTYARSLLPPDEAEDLVQDVFVLAAERIEKLMKSPSPDGWLAKALRFLVINWYERKSVRKQRDVEISELEAYIPAPDELDNIDVMTSVQAVLSPEEYKLYYRVYYEGASMTALAKEMNKAPATIWKKMERIRKHLTKAFFPG